MKKENDYDVEKFVSPLNPDCENTFTYYANGKINGMLVIKIYRNNPVPFSWNYEDGTAIIFTQNIPHKY